MYVLLTYLLTYLRLNHSSLVHVTQSHSTQVTERPINTAAVR